MANRFPLMSCFILEPLAREAFDRDGSTLRVVDPKLGAGIHAEVKFSQVAIQMLLVHVLIDPDQTALENAEEAFKGIRVNVAASPFVLAVIDRLMLIRLAHVDGRAVSDQTAAVVQVLDQMVADVLVVQIDATEIAAALDQGQHNFTALGIQGAIGAGLGRARQEGLISLHGHIRTAQRASIGRRRHRMANPMTDEPCRLKAAAFPKHPMDLTGANAFFAGAHQVNDLKPNRHRNMAVLEDGSDLDGELLATLVALAQSGPRGFAGEFMDARLIAIAAVRADWSGRPKVGFHILVSCCFITEMWGVEDRGHVRFSGIGESYSQESGVSSVTSPVG